MDKGPGCRGQPLLQHDPESIRVWGKPGGPVLTLYLERWT